VIVPCTIVPFFNSIVTVSFPSFIRNLQSSEVKGRAREKDGRGRPIEKMARRKDGERRGEGRVV